MEQKHVFFTLEYPDFPEHESGPDLVEHECLTNPLKDLKDKQIWTNTKTGNHSSASTKGHSYDDHRENHLLEFENNFAKTITEEIASLTQKHQSNQVVVVAESHVMGLMRPCLTNRLAKHITVQELIKNLCKHKSMEIQEYLAKKNLLPPRKVVNLKR
jgi:protein required for attachment to host cells